MKRPIINTIGLIRNQERVALRLQIDLQLLSEIEMPLLSEIEELEDPTSPWKNIRFFPRKNFRLLIEGLNDAHKTIFTKEFTNSSYGQFLITVPSFYHNEKLVAFKLYEISVMPTVQCFLGHFFPLDLPQFPKIIVSDFDKTLVETRYSTPKELWRSLRSPLKRFPTLENSLNLLKSHLQQGHIPFIVSASPHFYESAIRDWLYEHHIFTSNIFLKDYRKIFSLVDQELTPKDITKQSYYKLLHLIEIMMMCGHAQDLVLMGDGFESDLFIYTIFQRILSKKADPHHLWRMVLSRKEFNLTSNQQATFLLKVYELTARLASRPAINVKIYIRCRTNMINEIYQKDLGDKELNKLKELVHFYEN